MDIVVGNSVELKAAFASASDGDVIRLASGTYDWTRLADRQFENGVTITSADPGDQAVFETALHLDNVSGVTIDGIDIEATSLASYTNYARLLLNETQNVTLVDIDVSGHIPTAAEGEDPATASRGAAVVGYGYDMGLRARDSNGLVVRDVEISDVRTAALLQDMEGAILDDVEIHSAREGINLEDVRDVTIENSWFHDLKGLRSGASGDHPDMIQYWGVNSEVGIHDLTIRNNLFEQPEGEWTQTIFGHMRDAPEGVTASNFTITGNVIVNGHPNAIRLRHVDDVEIRDNILLPNSSDLAHGQSPTIMLVDVIGGTVAGNALLPRWNGTLTNLTPEEATAAGIEIMDNRALSDDPAHPDYWGRVPHDQPGMSGEAGTAGDDVLRAGSTDTFLDGGAGNDSLFEGEGGDVMRGGAGADRFVVDYRGDPDAARDVVLDFDFAEGDRLVFVGDRAGVYDIDADPTNRLTAPHDGKQAHIRDLADLREAEAIGAIHLEAGETGLVIRFADAPDHTLKLRDLTLDEVYRDAPEAGLTGTITGASGKDVLHAKSAGSVLLGRGGDDRIFEQAGDDRMSGGEGADRFYVDYRGGNANDHDIILDFDFAEGDRLVFVGDRAGVYDIDADPTNRLTAPHDGKQAHIRDLADLREAEAIGAIHLEAGETGLVIRFADAPESVVEIASMGIEDLAIL